MSSDFSDPSSDVTIAFDTGVSPQWSRIDDGIRSPTATGFDGNLVHAGPSDDNLENIYGLTNSANNGTVDTLTIFIRFDGSSSVSGDGNYPCRLKINGAFLSTVAITPVNGGWASNSYSGLNYGIQRDLQNMQVGIKTGSIAKGHDHYIEEVYVLYNVTSGSEPGSLIRPTRAGTVVGTNMGSSFVPKIASFI